MDRHRERRNKEGSVTSGGTLREQRISGPRVPYQRQVEGAPDPGESAKTKERLRQELRQQRERPSQTRPSRCAMTAASLRPATPSLPRMFETWTLAVFSLMNSCSPICRLLSPAATNASTSSSRE